MSTNKTPIHMRLYTLGIWYSRNRRNGQSRIQAVREAWKMMHTKWIINPNAVISDAIIGIAGALNSDAIAKAASIRHQDRAPIE